MESTMAPFCQRTGFYTGMNLPVLARRAAVSLGFQNLFDNINIHKTQMGHGPWVGHYCKANSLHADNLFIISDNAV